MLNILLNAYVFEEIQKSVIYFISYEIKEAVVNRYMSVS